MTNTHRWVTTALALTMGAGRPIASHAQLNETLTDKALTEKDRAEIQSLLAAYAPALL